MMRLALLTNDQAIANTPRQQNRGIEYIAPPPASPMDQENKTSFFKALRFNWKGLVSMS